MTSPESAWITEVLRPGDLVVVAGGAGEPTPLLAALVDAAATLPDLEVFVGLSHTDVLRRPGAGQLSLVSFGAMGPLARLAAQGRVAVLPCHFADVPRQLELRAPGRVVVVLQVSPADADGQHSLGLAVDHTWELLAGARAVVAEVNDQVPVTTAPRVHASRFTAVVPTSRPLVEVKSGSPDDVHRRIAAHVAALVPDGATLQLGVGTLPSVVASALRHRRDLRVRSTLVGSWLCELAAAGALAAGPDAVVLSEAAGSQELYDLITARRFPVCPVGEVAAPAALAAVPGFVAVNSALQVDLTGQVNAEELGTGYVAGVGGQPDWLRAAQRSPGGVAVVMLPATALGGRESRIARSLHGGAVTTPRSGVDVVVTEHGVADLRGRSLTERAAALTAVAAPEHRDSLGGRP
ncbi:acetyl-CoA hydrolase/transferase family protein [Klenkia brasiliensis]|uniref:Acyl-CoA hydrolase n=1 Tax=Klenkia brasiliensis TaxID=333142 RepID=A0A1G7TFH5_9ACTN|nr:acetyl-CoA hydrolase/transferase C-terminal domain-containing protein [Klenkia brasiliensis]SDG34086.1 Acyl-CoA hydrolase [Klenkia brasiliensis]